MPSSAQFFPSKETLKYDKSIDLKIYECSKCGLVQLVDKPVPYYKDVIRASAYSKEMKLFRQKQFLEFVKKNKLKNKSILEIGCGKGEYISLMQECNLEVYGIEHLQESVDVCILNNLNVTKDYIEDINYIHEKAPFNAFYILNFLEHIPNINIVLESICKNLADDGIGLIEVPNFDMILEQELFSEFISDHIFYFTQETLKRTLEINGFDILECNIIWHNYIISVVVKKRKKLNLSRFIHKQNIITNELQEYVKKYENVAIWGAGHQALSIISLSNISHNISYVIDSAPFKQGLYTHATHLLIVSPKILYEDTNIDAIIVMAASYSDEVVKLIKQYKADISISILRENGLELLK